MRWRHIALVALAVVVLVEVLLRLPQAEATLGAPELFYHPGVQERMDALERTQSAYGPVDILFVGSSVVRTNLRPFDFDAALAAAGYEVVSFNGGLSSMEIDPARVYLENLWLPRAEPGMVVQAVRYEDLVDAEPATEFEPFESGRYEKLWVSDSPMARLQTAALDNLRLVQYAGLLTEALVSPATARGVQGFSIDDRGFNSTQRHLEDVRRELAIEDIPGGPAASRGYAASLDPVVFADGFEMLEATIEAVRAAGAAYVMVNMPEHGDKFLPHPHGQARYSIYVEELRTFAARHGVPFIDLSGGDLRAFQDDTLFADFHHMTPEAALTLTQDLAEAFIDLRLPELLDQ
jgi:hypothetical protein